MSQVSLETIVRLAKQRGFVFPSSEIYGGFASSYDYGPLGVELKNNLRDLWWKHTVHMRRDVEGLDSAIVTHPKVWEASGHLANFTDPLVDCKKCKQRFRADHLLENKTDEEVAHLSLDEMAELMSQHSVQCPNCGGELTKPRTFNLLVETHFGPTQDKQSTVYLRGETCQSIYLDFKQIQESSRQKLPFGIAQIGKAFRNEITLENFIYRTREFEQMEMQYFVHEDDAPKWFDYWKEQRLQWYSDVLGIAAPTIEPREVSEEERAHYASRAVDLEFAFPFGRKELEGIHNRGAYDLTNHMRESGVDLQYFDQANNQKFIPHVVETSVGLTRLFLAVLSNAYAEESVGDDTRTVLKFPVDVAPVQVAVLPLSKKPELSSKTEEVYDMLKGTYVCQYDETQSIGRRYRRQDEIGTPLCVTVDFDTLDDRAVTIRHRDTMEQQRVPIERLSEAVSDTLATFTDKS